MVAAGWRWLKRLALARRFDLLAPLRSAPWPWRGLGLLMTPFVRPQGLYGARLAQALEALGPTYVKLGQMLATRGDLIGADLALSLVGLQDKMAPFAQNQSEAAIAEAFGAPWTSLFAELGPPIAAASIAQVHLARTLEGAKVAVKVLRPGIEAAMARDLDDLAFVAGLIETWVGPARRLKPRAVVATLRRSVMIELDLRMEAAAAGELAADLGDDPDFRVPKVDWRRTAKRVMTLEWVEGQALSDLDGLDPTLDREALAKRLVHAFLRQAMILGFFHADLHPGNLFVAPDGALVAVDFGIMGRLDAATSRFLALILKGFVERDYRAIAKLHVEAGYVPRDNDVEAFAQALRAIGEPIFDRPAEDISMGRLLTQLFEVTAQFDMETQPDLLLLQKTMVVVEGVARRLDPKLNMFETARPIVLEWLGVHASPRARLARWGADASALVDMARRLPRLAAKLDQVDPSAWAPRAADPWARLLAGLAVVLALVALMRVWG